MAVEAVTAKNYADFVSQERSVLVLATRDCRFCALYAPVVEELSEAFPQIPFGKAMLDEHFPRVKRDFASIIKGVPLTAMVRERILVGHFSGLRDFDAAALLIATALAEGEPVPKCPGSF